MNFSFTSSALFRVETGGKLRVFKLTVFRLGLAISFFLSYRVSPDCRIYIISLILTVPVETGLYDLLNVSPYASEGIDHLNIMLKKY